MIKPKWKIDLKRFATKKNIVAISSLLTALVVAGVALPFYVSSDRSIAVNTDLFASSSSSEAEKSSVSTPASAPSPAVSSEGSRPSDSSVHVPSQPQSTEPSQAAGGKEAPTKALPCSHVYAEDTTPPTCSSQGYTIHTCQNCGQSYTDSYLAPRHTFGKYLCEYCDLPDPSMNPYYSLHAWMRNHVPQDEYGQYKWVYQTGGAEYIIYSGAEGDNMTIEYSSASEHYMMYFGRTGDFIDTYFDRGEQFSRMVMMKPNLVLPSLPMFKDYEYLGPGDCSSEEFAIFYSNRIDDTLHVIDSQMLSPLGLTLKSFGFTSL